jgi:hypothetical protein
MAVQDRIAAARDESFSARVAFILMKSAVDIANESSGTTNHANRLAFAQRHFKAEVNTKAIAAAVIASNTTIQTTIDGAPSLKGANVSDADLEFVINSLIDNLANAYAAGV